MTTFAEHVGDHLRLRRALGFNLTEHARLLPKFAAHLDATGAAYITVDLALGSAVEPTVSAGRVVPAMRLLVVRGFARHVTGTYPRTEVPPTGLAVHLGDDGVEQVAGDGADRAQLLDGGQWMTPSPTSCWARSGSARLFTRAVTRILGPPSACAAPSSVSPRSSIARTALAC